MRPSPLGHVIQDPLRSTEINNSRICVGSGGQDCGNDINDKHRNAFFLLHNDDGRHQRISTFREKICVGATKARRTVAQPSWLWGGRASCLPDLNSNQARRPIASQARCLCSVRLALPSTPFEFRRFSTGYPYLHASRGHSRVSSNDSPVSKRLLRLARMCGHPFETASINFEPSFSIS